MSYFRCWCCRLTKWLLYCSCLPNSVLVFEGRLAVVRAVQHLAAGSEVRHVEFCLFMLLEVQWLSDLLLMMSDIGVVVHWEVNVDPAIAIFFLYSCIASNYSLHCSINMPSTQPSGTFVPLLLLKLQVKLETLVSSIFPFIPKCCSSLKISSNCIFQRPTASSRAY